MKTPIEDKIKMSLLHFATNRLKGLTDLPTLLIIGHENRNGEDVYFIHTGGVGADNKKAIEVIKFLESVIKHMREEVGA